MLKKAKNALLTVLFVSVLGVLTALFAILPKAERSQNEKRILAEKPDTSLSSITEGKFSKQLEEYFSDHFPFRDFFVGINSYTKLLLFENGASGIYKCKNGYLIAEPGNIDLKKAESNINTLLSFASRTGLPSSAMAVPTPGYIMKDLLPSVHKEYRDGEVLSLLKKSCKDTKFIDLQTPFFSLANSTQLYYKTDHHLTSRGSLVMYEEFCKARSLQKYDFTLSQTEGGFYGTAYSKSGLWLTKPDDVEIYKSDNTSLEVTLKDGEKETKSNSLYFYSHFDDMDKYPVFLDGNHAVATLKNGSCHNGKRLLLIKDSYAHCFATFLIENYEEICMIDLRHFRGNLSEIIESDGLNELLFLFGTENLASSTDIPWLSVM